MLIEKIRRKPINSKIENTIHAIGFVLLLLLMVVITWQDIVRIFKRVVDVLRQLTILPNLPEELKSTAKGCCRVRDGYTVLIRKEEAGNTETRAASLEEIMIHLEKEGEEA